MAENKIRFNEHLRLITESLQVLNKRTQLLLPFSIISLIGIFRPQLQAGGFVSLLDKFAYYAISKEPVSAYNGTHIVASG
jgi:hypothetical protein